MDDGIQLVGVVGDPPAGLDAVVTDTGSSCEFGDVPSVFAHKPDLVVAVGSAACLQAARATLEVPILAVDAGNKFHSVPADAATDVVADVLGGGAQTESVPVMCVEHGGDVVGRAVTDVTLVSAKVAHISEYGVRTGDRPVSQFRADGVVVATPAGSTGYAKRVGGPLIAPGTGVASVVPIGPFATDPDHWVVSLTEIQLSVERDETRVTLLADDQEVATVSKGERVRITRGGTAEFISVAESSSHFS